MCKSLTANGVECGPICRSVTFRELERRNERACNVYGLAFVVRKNGSIGNVKELPNLR